MATLFVDFGAFMAYTVEEVGIAVDTEGYFEKCSYIKINLEVDLEANIK
jgi:hypothetical protein